MPAIIATPSVSRGKLVKEGGGRQRTITQISRIWRTALNANEAAAPPKATIAPPMAGPALRAMLKLIALSATAPGRSARAPMSPAEACQAGPLKATPQPRTKVKASSSHGVITPAHAQADKAAETSRMKL